MILEYDKAPGLTEEQKLQSLMQSVQMALDEIYKENDQLKQKVATLEKEVARLSEV